MSISYKTKLISIYVGITLFGIALTLIAIYNASHEQLVLDQINTMRSVFEDRLKRMNSSQSSPEQLARNLSTEQYPVISIPLRDTTVHKLDGCTLRLDNTILDETRMNSSGGLLGDRDCSFNWAILNPGNTEYALLLLHKFSSRQQNASIFSAYTNRLAIPLVFFAWMAVWGSLMLGNLVNRLKIQKDEVEHMAMHDNLTGLPNRKFFSEKIHELINTSPRQHMTPFTLAMVDLNKFKNVNDNLGHHFGDLLLKQVAQRFSESIRDEDMAARLGGDEFILLLTGPNKNASIRLLEKIHDTIIREYTLLDNTVEIGASIGVSYYPDHDLTYSDLLHKADIAMYMAKSSGGGIKVYESQN